jgi:type II secretory pathway pseudopilin PulG
VIWNKKRLSPKLIASTLVEVLVSLSLVSIIFIIVSIIWLQISGPQASFRDTEHRLQSRRLIEDAISNNDPRNKIITIGTTKYVRQVTLIHKQTQLFEISVAVYITDKKPIMQRSKIARIHAN